MQMRISRVFLTHRANHITLMHRCAWNHSLRDAVEMQIDKEQVLLPSVGSTTFSRICVEPKPLSAGPARCTTPAATGMDRCTNRSGQVDAVMEIPAISVNTRTEGRVHFVGRGAVAEWPDEVTGDLEH